jgi:predicted Zn finger-like uncharacterized protein
MILNCNSCEKKFVVPDHAISAEGRVVQCGSCGNKWRQFPINNEANKINVEKRIDVKKTTKIPKLQKPKKKKQKKTREIDLYSPAYLEKKHGITLKDTKIKNDNISKKEGSFGFYNSLILFIFIVITVSRGLYFFQEYIVLKLPFTEFYLDYFFENIRNIFEICKNLVFNY